MIVSEIQRSEGFRSSSPNLMSFLQFVMGFDVTNLWLSLVAVDESLFPSEQERRNIERTLFFTLQGSPRYGPFPEMTITGVYSSMITKSVLTGSRTRAVTSVGIDT
jgi:hypothetical protein